MADWDELIIEKLLASGGAAELLRAGDALFAAGEYSQALFYYLALARRHPEVADHHFRVGLACAQLGQREAAQFSFEEAIRFQPDHAGAHGELRRLLQTEGKIEQALDHARRAVELAPDDADAAVGLAALLEVDRRTDAAWEIMDRLLGEGRETPQLALLYAVLAPSRKRETAALEMIVRVLQAGTSRQAREQSSLHFAAAKLLDSLGRYDDAFEHASQANALRAVKYYPAEAERQVREWIEYLTRPTLRRLPRATHGNETPVFIIGMPRSGTTLLEQILASHPQVYGAGELDWVSGLWKSMLRRHEGMPASLTQCLDRMSTTEADELAAEYLTPLAALAPAATRIIDKMPFNVMNLGLIAILFPWAKIIHCRRDPLDTCLSCFMTDFTSGHDYSHALTSAGHLYRQYERIQAHWKSALDLKILDVDYEAVVTDLPGQTDRMLEFLDLPWDDNCLRFYENRRFVATASNAQVRLPIYDKSVGRWRHYEKHLEPLKAALAEGGRVGR